MKVTSCDTLIPTGKDQSGEILINFLSGEGGRCAAQKPSPRSATLCEGKRHERECTVAVDQTHHDSDTLFCTRATASY